MALIKCKECGHKISKKAKACPSCGANLKKSGSGCLLLIVGIILLIVASSYFGDIETDNEASEVIPDSGSVEVDAPEVESDKPKVFGPEVAPSKAEPEEERPSVEYTTVTLAQALANKELWPDQVTLEKDQQIDIIMDGEIVGSQIFEAGAQARLLSLSENDKLNVERNNTKFQVPVAETDFLEAADRLQRAIAYQKQAEEARKREEEIAKRLAEKEESKRQAEIQKKIDKQFGSDGSHSAFRRYIKKNLKDPSSFKYMDTKAYKLSENEIVVIMKYRAKNSFGGYTIETASGIYDAEGNFKEFLGVD